MSQEFFAACGTLCLLKSLKVRFPELEWSKLVSFERSMRKRPFDSEFFESWQDRMASLLSSVGWSLKVKQEDGNNVNVQLNRVDGRSTTVPELEKELQEVVHTLGRDLDFQRMCRTIVDASIEVMCELRPEKSDTWRQVTMGMYEFTGVPEMVKYEIGLMSGGTQIMAADPRMFTPEHLQAVEERYHVATMDVFREYYFQTLMFMPHEFMHVVDSVLRLKPKHKGPQKFLETSSDVGQWSFEFIACFGQGLLLDCIFDRLPADLFPRDILSQAKFWLWNTLYIDSGEGRAGLLDWLKNADSMPAPSGPIETYEVNPLRYEFLLTGVAVESQRNFANERDPKPVFKKFLDEFFPLEEEEERWKNLQWPPKPFALHLDSCLELL